MKKVKLNLEELKVDSFETVEVEESKGTVNGFVTHFKTCEFTNLMGCPTYKISCELICP